MSHVRILRLNKAGQPTEWINWQTAACLYSRNLVIWTLGEEVIQLHGGICRLSNKRSTLGIHSIIACDGDITNRKRLAPPLTNRALFKRDQNVCLYCGDCFPDGELTRDHVVPISKGGRDNWMNVVAACRRCNHKKGNHLLETIDLDLLALPFCPNLAEYLTLVNSGRILGDQMEFLKAQFPVNSRLLKQ